eukprot:CAMPEP_0185850872 /NCGR_PEP_ID=MMETSP1354-20130828/4837_1 /TAXON_ID=708628 /ORGANISM="Erythrolobus madagascarensis, Strain CCMP3276" /LENGTH=503 /DNA_ID=CAMNT_0028551599 /DNA_START=26 /DNA_END=1540 /DNA_ORIENTATION=+
MSEPAEVAIGVGTLMGEKKRAVSTAAGSLGAARRYGSGSGGRGGVMMVDDGRAQRKQSRVLSLIGVVVIIWLLVLLRLRLSSSQIRKISAVPSFIFTATTELAAAPLIRAREFPPSAPHIYGAFPRLAFTHFHQPLNESSEGVSNRTRQAKIVSDAETAPVVSLIDMTVSIVSPDCQGREWPTIREWIRENIQQSSVPRPNAPRHGSLEASDFIQSVALQDVPDLHNAQLSITHVSSDDTVYASEVSRLVAHLTAWRHAFHRKARHVLILEQHTVLSSSMVQQLPALLQQADRATIARSKPWHIIHLSSELDLDSRSNDATDSTDPSSPASSSSSCWLPSSSFGNTVSSSGSQGESCMVHTARPYASTADAYVLSAEGLNFLLSRVVSYHMPLDALLHQFRESWYKDEFVVLTACKRGRLSTCTRSSLELFTSQESAESSAGGACKANLGVEQTGVSAPGSAFPAAIPVDLSQKDSAYIKEEHKKEWYWREIRAPEFLGKDKK